MAKENYAIQLLRRVNAGDEKVLPDIEKYLAEIDQAAKESAEYWAEVERKRTKARKKREEVWTRFEKAPQSEGGVDYSAAGKVLMRNKTHRLVWRPGGNYWSGMGSQSYGNAELEIMAPHYRDRIELTNNHGDALDGTKPRRINRLSVALVLKYREQIDAVFGVGATGDMLTKTNLKKTLVLE